MTIPDILALDFDGVCCDGLREYFEASRRAHACVWPRGPMPGDDDFPAFCALRPVILSGWEMPVLLRAIALGRSQGEILSGWERVRDEITTAGPLPGGELISRLWHALDEARREWIAVDPEGWLALHVPYCPIAELARLVAEPRQTVLVTTKDGVFARLVLDHWSVRLADVQGKETGVHKCENLRALIASWAAAHGRRPRLAFVEDRLETLQHVTSHPDLDDVALFLAAWGYNTEAARAGRDPVARAACPRGPAVAWSSAMKIARVEALHCDGGWRPWTFVRIETDDGLVGWGECSDNRSPHGLAGCVRDLAPLLVGQDPRPVERLYWDMLRATRQNLGGVTHKAMAGIELALWDIKAKALGVPVYELFGGPLRDRMRLYWSHCGTTRARLGHVLGTPPLRTYEDIAALGREVVARGFTALKTNMVIPGDPATVYFPGFASGINTTDGAPSVEILEAIERLIGTFRDAVGPRVGLCLDLNYNFRTEGALRVAKLLEQFDMQWVEYDNWDPQALLQIKQSTSTRLASLESLVTTRQYRPFFELHAVDVAIIDVPWNGFSQAVQIGRMAETYEINIAPHNYYSHLADLHSLHLCAVLPNVRIMEIDIDDVPWKAELVTKPPVIKDGHIFLTDAPGWGADINEEVLRAHPWSGPGAGARMFYGMSPDKMGARPPLT